MSSCPSCHQAYEPEAKRPRVLPCGHSVCSECLVQLHRQNSGEVPCPCCGEREYHAYLRHVPVNLALEAMVAGLSQEKEEQGAAAAAAGPSPPPREEAALPATPRVLAHAGGPFKLSPGERIRTLDLPRGVEGDQEGLSRRRSTTHLEFKFDQYDDDAWLDVDHLDGAGQQIFRTAWRLFNDTVRMLSFDPAGATSTPVTKEKMGCGLRADTVHQARIVEDRQQYEVFLDGVSMGCIEKAGGPSTPPAVAKIRLHNGFVVFPPTTTIEILRLFVESE